MSERTHVLIAEDDDEVRRWIDRALTRAGFAPTAVAAGREVLERLGVDPRPDLMVLDLRMPDGGATDVRPPPRAPCTVPVAEPFDARELIARVRSHLRVSVQAAGRRDGADRDPLTGLLGRRGFLAHLGDEIERVSRTDASLAVVFIDLDHVDDLDDLGRVAGDPLLVRVAGALEECAGRGAIVGRWGGDELVVAVPDADAGALAARIEGALRRRLEAEPVSASLGVAWLRARDVAGAAAEHLPMALIEAADRAMYDAKAARAALHRL